MKKCKILILVFALLLSMLVGGCSGKDKKAPNEIFYLNMDVTKLIPYEYEPKGTTTEELVKEYLDALASDPKENDMRRVISDKISVLGFEFQGYMLSLNFSNTYYDMTPTEEILCRAAIVRTLLQIEGISYVFINVDSTPLIDSKGNVVGGMNQESFVENPGKQINSSLSTTLTLYFATEDGTQLEKETRKVHYSSNISVEKLVMEQLLEGPRTKGLKSAIPAETKLITISVVDRVCYVNLDESFRNQNDEIAEPVVLYSIVNSLTELPTVSKVQISINGDTKGKCRYIYDLSDMYEFDDEYVKPPEEEVPVTEENIPVTEIP